MVSILPSQNVISNHYKRNILTQEAFKLITKLYISSGLFSLLTLSLAIQSTAWTTKVKRRYRTGGCVVKIDTKN
jgi:hypothetical protein